MAIVSGQETCLTGSVVTGTFAATGTSTAVRVDGVQGVSLTLYGTFVGTVALEKSYDGGSNYATAYVTTTAISFTAPASVDITKPTPETGVLYRLNCSAYTSGTVNYRLSH